MIGMMWMHRVVLFLPSVRFVVCALCFIVDFFLRTRSVRGEGGALPDYIFVLFSLLCRSTNGGREKLEFLACFGTRRYENIPPGDIFDQRPC